MNRRLRKSRFVRPLSKRAFFAQPGVGTQPARMRLSSEEPGPYSRIHSRPVTARNLRNYLPDYFRVRASSADSFEIFSKVADRQQVTFVSELLPGSLAKQKDAMVNRHLSLAGHVYPESDSPMVIKKLK